MLPSLTWQTARGPIAVDRPLVSGIVNVTPDSFSDGGEFFSTERAVAHGEALVAEGADILDVGGESTRPQGAVPVDAGEELRRVLPVVTELARRLPRVPLSVDTVKSEVAAAALDAGAWIVNDVSGFRLDPRMGEICAARGAGVVLMHSRGTVSEMGTYRHAEYGAVVSEVIAELRAARDGALAAGVAHAAIVLDPGFGFAKRTEHSLAVLAALPRVAALGHPVLVGVSRKRFVGELSGVKEPAQRVAGTIGANVAALARGARLFRVHDVAANRQALDVAWAVARAMAAQEAGA